MRDITPGAARQALVAMAVSLGSGCASRALGPRAPEAPFLRASAIIEHAPPSIEETDGVSAELELAPSPVQLEGSLDPRAPASPPAASPAPRAAPPRAELPPGAVIARANDMASQAPDESGFVNAVMTYAYVPGGFYKIFAAPWYVTQIALEPGEELLGPVAGGDPTRWRLDVGTGAVGDVPQKHIFIKPLRAGLKTNLTLTTNRRVYLLDLESLEDTFMVSVRWTYPQDAASAPAPYESAAAPPPAAAPRAPTELDRLHFDYEIEVVSGKPSWTPRAVYDDGVHTYVRFDRQLLTGEAPALYVRERGELQIVNYRVKDTLYIVDRIFDVAELRLGNDDDQDVVRLRNRRRAEGRKATPRGSTSASRRPGSPR